MYDNGNGVPEDDVEAVKWFRKSAEQGDASAQYFLGLMYAKGEGVPKDLVEAHVWFNLVGAKGEEYSANSKEARAEIEMKLTKFQIAKATKLARERFKRLSK
jgi:TPR repeat protein